MKFLTAKWQNLILINYKVDPSILKPFIPEGTTLDLYNNTCYISLVGFMFKDTKVIGIKVPRHVNFEEVNLRFYVKHNNNRGVVFIKEMVPKPMITKIANSIYKEHYQTLKMDHKWIEDDISSTVEYSWKTNNKWQRMSVTSKKTPLEIPSNSVTNFITEHYYGYTKHNKTTYEYEVQHPKWKQLKIKDFKIDVDFELSYGSKFEFLNKQEPTSVILALGSNISVAPKKTINPIYTRKA